jgi:hypothetical protein
MNQTGVASTGSRRQALKNRILDEEIDIASFYQHRPEKTS